jgi:hypothetical protein
MVLARNMVIGTARNIVGDVKITFPMTGDFVDVAE